MEQVAPILQAVASLLWIVFAFVVLLMFRTQITRALGRLTKAEFFGQSFELTQELKTLQTSTEALGAQQSPPEESRVIGTNEAEKVEAPIKSILQQATSSPKVALMALRAELEKQAQQALATRGMLCGTVVSLSQALNELGQYWSPNLQASLKLFEDVRNKIIHGSAGTDDDALKALDSGITILRALNALPTEVNVVYHPGVELFSDPTCSTPIPDAKGVILETTSPGGVMKSFRIFATTRTHFQKGKQVAWEWNSQKKWPAVWYRDPDTGAIRQAWTGSAEFIGRHLDDIAGANTL